MNLSTVPDAATARTCPAAAAQRAANLAMLGATRVLELCVGPSLRTLTRAYAAHGIVVTGNDVDARWLFYDGRSKPWRVGDALTVPWDGHDAVVFAPPLSRGCTGRREDALRIGEVTPRYVDFLARLDREPGVHVAVLVLPARALATRADRTELHNLLSVARQGGRQVEIETLLDARGRVVKYVDAYLTRRAA